MFYGHIFRHTFIRQTVYLARSNSPDGGILLSLMTPKYVLLSFLCHSKPLYESVIPPAVSHSLFTTGEPCLAPSQLY